MPGSLTVRTRSNVTADWDCLLHLHIEPSEHTSSSSSSSSAAAAATVRVVFTHLQLGNGSQSDACHNLIEVLGCDALQEPLCPGSGLPLAAVSRTGHVSLRLRTRYRNDKEDKDGKEDNEDIAFSMRVELVRDDVGDTEKRPSSAGQLHILRVLKHLWLLWCRDCQMCTHVYCQKSINYGFLVLPTV